MEILIQTDQTEQEVTNKLSELREFLKDSGIDVVLVTNRVESMSGHVCNKYYFKLEKKDD